MKKQLAYALLAATLATGTLAATTGAASAYVACNATECWHTDARVARPGVHLVYHPDDWYFHRSWTGAATRWHDYHQGRGYWRNGVWITF